MFGSRGKLKSPARISPRSVLIYFFQPLYYFPSAFHRKPLAQQLNDYSGEYMLQTIISLSLKPSTTTTCPCPFSLIFLSSII